MISEVSNIVSNRIITWTAWISALVRIAAGVFLHFAFELSGSNTLVGAFTPVNESIWEHLKLILFPAVLIGAVQYAVYGKKEPDFLAARATAILIGMVIIVVGDYTYSGILGRDFAAANIALFVIAAILTEALTEFFLKVPAFQSENAAIAAILFLSVVMIFFFYFTFHPPMLELFRDPVTEDFGIQTVRIRP